MSNLQHRSCTAHRTQQNAPKRKTLESQLPPFNYWNFLFICSSSDHFHRAKLWQGRYEFLGAQNSLECAKATALFVSSFGPYLVAELRTCGCRRLNFRFLVLYQVVGLFFCCRTRRRDVPSGLLGSRSFHSRKKKIGYSSSNRNSSTWYLI